MALNEDFSSKYTIRPHGPVDLEVICNRHDFLYARDFGWKDDFIGATAVMIADLRENFNPDLERVFVGENKETREFLGTVTITKHRQEPDTAQLRFLLVEPTARGTGIGSRLVNEAVEFARAAGYKRIILWTVSILVGARRIYDRAGFKLVKVEEEKQKWGARLSEELWQLELSPLET
ncbi:acyl-CoA N-acyltransferase [Xylariaceae sp. FL0255]|nr:acyl-CoA N-acyltransferase [Xylariaceae sp. FL0255]